MLPRISPSGRLLAFASDTEQPGLWRLYILSLDGAEQPAEPQVIERLPGVVEDIVWAKDESGLIVRTADEGSDAGNARGGTRFAPAAEAEAPFIVGWFARHLNLDDPGDGRVDADAHRGIAR